MVIAMGDIVAFIQAAAANKNAISAFGEGPEDKFQVDSSGTHNANEPDIRRILQSGNSSQVSGAVCSPMAYKTNDCGSEQRACTHVYLAWKCYPQRGGLRGVSRFLNRSIDLAQQLLVGKVLENNRPGRAYGVAQPVAFADHRIDDRLIALSRFTKLDGIIGAYLKAGPAAHTLFLSYLANGTRNGDDIV